MKIIISAIIAACIICGTVPTMESWVPNTLITADAADTVASGTCGDSAKWSLNSLGTLYVTGTGSTENYGVSSASYKSSDMSDIKIEFYNSVPPWYEYRDEIKKIAVGGGIKYLGSGAFAGLTNVTSVSLPDGLDTINSNVFELCLGLTSVDIPDTVSFIGGYVFDDCRNLSSLDLGSGVTMLGTGALRNCQALSSIDLPASLDQIGDGAFSVCTSLEAINVDSNNQYFKSISGVLVNKDVTEVIAYPAGKTAGSCTVPNTVETIADMAFACNRYLRTVKLQSPLKTIGEEAFIECINLTSITIPESVTTIGDYAFYFCSELEDVVLPKSLESLGAGAFYFCEALQMVVVQNPDCIIGDGYTRTLYLLDDDDSVVGYKGSTAQEYAEDFECNFDLIRNKGDVNADSQADSSDAALILQHYAKAQSDGNGTLTYYTKKYIADYNSDGSVDSSDAAMLLKYYAENQAK